MSPELPDYADEKAEDALANAPDLTDFDEMTVPEAKEALEEADPIDLRGALIYERNHEGRVTLTQWLEDRLPDDDEDEDTGPPEEIVVTNGEYVGFAAGIHFENPHELHEVTRNARIERAIESGILTESNAQV